MSEFELTIRCSKDIRRITLDFGDSSEGVVDFSEKGEHLSEKDRKTSSSKNNPVDPLERYLAVQQTAPEKKSTASPAPSTLPVPDVQGRPPLVDEGFNESL